MQEATETEEAEDAVMEMAKADEEEVAPSISERPALKTDSAEAAAVTTQGREAEVAAIPTHRWTPMTTASETGPTTGFSRLLSRPRKRKRRECSAFLKETALYVPAEWADSSQESLFFSWLCPVSDFATRSTTIPRRLQRWRRPSKRPKWSKEHLLASHKPDLRS